MRHKLLYFALLVAGWHWHWLRVGSTRAHRQSLFLLLYPVP